MKIYQDSMDKVMCPSGNFNAICVGVYDLGVQPSKNGWPAKRKVAICFEVEKKIEAGPLAGQPYRLSRIVSTSLNRKSALSEMLVSWFGRDPVGSENGNRVFDFAALIGKPCTISVAHHAKDGDTRAFIQSISGHMDGMPVLKSDFDPYGQTPDWIERMRSHRINPREPLLEAKPPQACATESVQYANGESDDDALAQYEQI